MQMKQFYTAYQTLSILRSAMAKLANTNGVAFMQSATAELPTEASEAFWRISFSHHILLLGKRKTHYKRLFYMAQAAYQYSLVILLRNY